MPLPDVKFKLNIGISDKEYNSLSFGRRLEYDKLIQTFCESADKHWASQKGSSFNSAIANFKKLYKPTQWYVKAFNKSKSPQYYDDSFVIYYTV